MALGIGSGNTGHDISPEKTFIFPSHWQVIPEPENGRERILFGKKKHIVQ